MLSALLVLCWLCSSGAQWAGVLAQPAQHAERQVGHTSPPIPPDPGLTDVILTSSSASSQTTSSTASSSTSSHVMTSTSSAQTPSSTQSQFVMNAVKNMTTCGSGIITWNYNGSSANILLSITNVGVLDPYPQRDLTRRQNTAGQDVTVTLTNISAILNSWTWPQDPTSTATAVETYTRTPSVGEIVGVVVGTLAGLVILVLAIAYYLRRRRRSPTRGSKPKQNVGRRWSSLRSNDSAARSLAGGNDSSTHSHGHSESLGEMLIVGKTSETTTTQGSDEVFRKGMIPLDAIDTSLPRHNRRISVQSLQGPYPLLDPSFRGDVGPIRVSSTHYSKQNLELQAARIRSSMESTMYLRTERFSLPAAAAPIPLTPTSPSRGRDEYPPSPGAATSARRSPSAGAATTRRASRKPVPYYDASEFHDDLRSTADNQSTLTAGESSHSHGTESLSPLHSMSGLSHNRIHYLIPDMPPPRNE
ncbi:hypothetical protein EDB19DRAFT_1917850 [Suillus lakei]|nr:hypothetical protein EDB19DRAFT_1917850 [Suillus lakei]